MRLTNFFLPTKKEIPSEAKLTSDILMIRAGMIKMEISGIYTWLPLGYKILKKIKNIIIEEHEKKNINHILMPTIQSADIWRKSNRYESYGKEMLRINDRNKKDLLYGPTNEEMVTAIGKEFIKSYKNLPLYLFHIQSKFRDEIRPRFGVMRAREFLMKDAYSFDINQQKGIETYKMFFQLYLDIFKKLGINIVPVRALSGEIGGDLSHEFHLKCKTGESEIVLDDFYRKENQNLKYDDYKTKYSSTDEYYQELTEKPKNIFFEKSIELGHIFLFGTKYSESFDFKINFQEGFNFPYMGSYGIGITRIPAAVIENSNDENGIIWPKAIAPFDLIILNLMPEEKVSSFFCDNLYFKLNEKKFDVLYDDRNERVGVKFSDADLIGIPYQIIVGKDFSKKKIVEIKNRKTYEKIEVIGDEVINTLNKMINND